MSALFVSALLIVLTIVLVLVFIFLCLWVWSIFAAATPFMPVPQSILPAIYKALAIDEASVVYHIGSGDGRVLLYLSKQMPESRLLGLENNKFSLVLSRIRLRFSHHKKQTTVQIIETDFSAHDMSSATHIFTYLQPQMLDELLPLLDKQLQPGTRLVSAAFQFTQKRPIEEIDLDRSRYQLARKLYVYEF